MDRWEKKKKISKVVPTAPLKFITDRATWLKMKLWRAELNKIEAQESSTRVSVGIQWIYWSVQSLDNWGEITWQIQNATT